MTATPALTQVNVRRPRRPWPCSIVWLAVLGSFFFLSYGFANWFTSQRTHVGGLAFGWERHIPFLPWTIIPYWSIDVLYCVSFFLCLNPRELSTHVKRLFTAQAISIIGFLLVPLRFTFERPVTHGFFGWMFDLLMGFDKPFNQAPSLHISLAVLLSAKYEQHTPGKFRWLVRGWFILIGLSTLTTYQHHLIDLPTGLWVGLLCLTLFPETTLRAATPRPRLAAAYALASLLFGAAAIYLGGIGLLLLWPAGACAVISAIYATGRLDWFGKHQNGHHNGAARWLLAPYLWAARTNARWWSKREPEWAQEITPGLWLGRLPSKQERDALGIRSLVDLTAELRADTAGLIYRSVPMLDLATPTPAALREAVAAIDDLHAHRPTLVCCALGYSRSAAVVAAWLCATGEADSLDDAIRQIRARRPRIVLNAAHLREVIS